jgi:hypothetical protein
LEVEEAEQQGGSRICSNASVPNSRIVQDRSSSQHRSAFLLLKMEVTAAKQDLTMYDQYRSISTWLSAIHTTIRSLRSASSVAVVEMDELAERSDNGDGLVDNGEDDGEIAVVVVVAVVLLFNGYPT